MREKQEAHAEQDGANLSEVAVDRDERSVGLDRGTRESPIYDDALLLDLPQIINPSSLLHVQPFNILPASSFAHLSLPPSLARSPPRRRRSNDRIAELLDPGSSLLEIFEAGTDLSTENEDEGEGSAGNDHDDHRDGGVNGEKRFEGPVEVGAGEQMEEEY